MVSGDAAARSFDPNTMTWSADGKSGTPVSNRITFACVSSKGGLPETPGFNVPDCDQGLPAQVHFQSCWDGKNPYKSDQSNVAYLSGMDNGVYPPDYPILLPHLFFEVIYFTNTVSKRDRGMFVFLRGDTTGYGFHGEFLNDWDMDVLTNAVHQCMGATASDNGQIGLCPPLQASVDPYASQNRPEQPLQVQEAVHGLINVLPGCNSPTDEPIRATENICPVQPLLDPIVKQDNKTRAVAIFGQKSANWQYLGCALDTGTPRPVTSKSYYYAGNTTIESCTAYCKSNNYYYTGMEFGNQCYCSNILQQPTQSPLNCGQQAHMVCSGNLLEYCGGQNVMQVWTDPTFAGPIPQEYLSLS
jgi:hypothetical protein